MPFEFFFAGDVNQMVNLRGSRSAPWIGEEEL